MPEKYIKQEDAIQAIESVPNGNWSKVRYKEAVVNVPVVEVEPVRRGYWMKAKDRGCVSYADVYAECSACHGDPVFNGRTYKRCPHCGAYLSVVAEGISKGDTENAE